MIVLMSVAQALCMLGLTACASILPQLQSNWQLSSVQAGVLSGVSFLGYVIAVPIATRWTDYIDARRVYGCATLVAAAGSLTFCISTNLVTAIIGQTLFGLGFAGLNMPGLKAMTDRIDGTSHSKAVALYTSISGIGLAVAYVANGIIASLLGWRYAFAIDTVAVLGSGLIALAILEPLPPTCRTGRPVTRRAIRELLSNIQACMFIMRYMAHSWELFGFRAWIIGLLVHMLPGDIGSPLLLPSLYAAGLAAFGAVTNIFCSALSKSRGRDSLANTTMMCSVAAAIFTAFSWTCDGWIPLIATVLYYGLIMADSGILTAGTIASTPPEFRGLALGIHSMLGFLCGSLSPIAFGLVLDLFGGQSDKWAWSGGFILLATPSIISLLVQQRSRRVPSSALTVS